MYSIWICAVVITSVAGVPTVSNETENEYVSSEVSGDSFMRCTHEKGIGEVFDCAAKRALKIVHQARKMESIELFPGVALIEDKSTLRDGKAINDEIIPVQAKQGIEKAIALIVNEAVQILSGRTLSIKLPETTPLVIARALEEGRLKMKKKMSPLLLGLGIKALLLKAIFIAVIGAIAIKALFISKVAFVLALIGAGQSIFSLFSGGLGSIIKGGGPYPGTAAGYNFGTTYGAPGWTTNSIGGGWTNSQYPYARSLDKVTDDLQETQRKTNELVYSAHKQ